MLTIKDISTIIEGSLYDVEPNELNKEINDFETIYSFVKSKNTAYFSPNKETWWKELGRSKNAPDGNDLIDKSNENIGLIITEKYVENMEHKIPQLIVHDSVKAIKKLATYIRNQYKNPVIAITGSMGKSSTRMLTSSLLQDYNVLENRGNNNIRAAIYANMLKLIKNPDFAVIETSLNAINHRENTALYLKPDIAVITGIGAAHYSTFKSIHEIAELKARIFAGLNKNGIAIINGDTMFLDYLKQQALQFTENVQTYSIDNTKPSNLAPSYINYLKGAIQIGIENNHDINEYQINTISDGMISNTLGALLIMKNLNVPINPKHLYDFKPFSKILKMKKVITKSHQLTLIDDTHNTSLPAMINAIKAFDSQTQFFSGNKIIAIGKINDLGHKSKEIHQELIPYLTNSNADHILCLDDDLRPVVNKINNKNITWYPNKELMINDLKYLCNSDSITLLKSSSGGTEFPEIAKTLPHILKRMNLQNEEELFSSISKAGKSYIIVDNVTSKIEHEYNTENSMTVEGMGPLLYYMNAIDENAQNEELELQEWVTNNSTFFKGKKVNVFSLLSSMTKGPHPSETYELVDYLFENFANRKKYTNFAINKFNLSNSIAINLTGRFRVKERQSFTVGDLFNIYKNYKYSLFKFNNYFLIGLKYKSGFIRGDNKTIIFTSFANENEAKEILFHYTGDVK
ncbi:Mur ligase family protein [Staphylococcus pasteuri]|uniref:Mur ligase family protein n=2 Tax=Staphylococcus TaxID=1279 RepID=UPI0030BC5F6E